MSINIPATADEWTEAKTKVWIEYGGLRLQEVTYTQGFNISISGAPASVNKYGEDIILNLAGYFPAVNLRAVNAADVSKIVSNVVTCAATGTPTANGTNDVTLSVYPNSSGADRNVKFQYEKSTGVWVDIATASQEWTGLNLPTKGFIASPGVIGVGAESGKLTLDGSKEYSPDGKGNAGETVYVVYFKWGSTVALSAGTGNDGDTFDNTDVAWVPAGFERTITNTWSTVPYQSVNAASFPAQDNAAGLGDPCKLAVQNGSTGGYRMPTETSEFNWPPNYTSATTYYGINGRMDNTNTQFYPFTGYRDTNGKFIANNISPEVLWGAYWTTNRITGTQGGYTAFNHAYIYPGGQGYAGNGVRTNGYAIRCIKE